jgi:hypothetical protein
MKINELDQFLGKYTKDELFYKSHYIASQNPDTYKTFLENINLDFIEEKKIIIPYFYPEFDNPYTMTENSFFFGGVFFIQLTSQSNATKGKE